MRKDILYKLQNLGNYRHNCKVQYRYSVFNGELLVNVHMYWAPVHCNLNLASRSFNRSCGLLRHWSQTLCFLIITFARLCNLQESNFSVVLLCSQVFESGIGELVVLRRPTVETPAHMYSRCTLRYGFCHKTSLASHVAKCKLRDPSQKLASTDSYSDGMTLMAPYLPNKDVAELQYDKLLAGMRDPSKTAGI